MTRWILVLLSLSTAYSQELLEQCKDVAGVRHKVGDNYIGEDGCNKCRCMETGSACTKKFCFQEDKAIIQRSAEANKCVDNHGVLFNVGETYTHVDGCNTCRCTENGGACTRKFCLQEPRQMSACQDKENVWLHEDGCNKCLCGPFGAVCTEQICGQHRGWTDDKNDAHIDEITHSKEGSYVNEDGDQTCRDPATNQDKIPGDTWLSEDGCNICTCRGDNSVPACTKMGCRERLARLTQASDANHVITSSALIATVTSLLIVRLL